MLATFMHISQHPTRAVVLIQLRMPRIFRLQIWEPQEALGETLAQANNRGSNIGYVLDSPGLYLEDCDLKGWDDIGIEDVEDGDGDEGLGELECFTGMY